MGASKAACALASIIACSAGTIGCGEEDRRAEPSWKPDPERVRAVERDAYAVTCADVNRHLVNARLIRRAATRLSANPRLAAVSREITFQRVVQSMDYALQAICERRPGDFMPARTAVERVRDGTYRSTLCVGPGCK
jgi:hypothetical protein